MNQSESSLCRVFLVDDDLLVLDDLRELIAWEAEGFEIIGTAGNGEQAVSYTHLDVYKRQKRKR